MNKIIICTHKCPSGAIRRTASVLVDANGLIHWQSYQSLCQCVQRMAPPMHRKRTVSGVPFVPSANIANHRPCVCTPFNNSQRREAPAQPSRPFYAQRPTLALQNSRTLELLRFPFTSPTLYQAAMIDAFIKCWELSAASALASYHRPARPRAQH